MLSVIFAFVSTEENPQDQKNDEDEDENAKRKQYKQKARSGLLARPRFKHYSTFGLSGWGLGDGYFSRRENRGGLCGSYKMK